MRHVVTAVLFLLIATAVMPASTRAQDRARDDVAVYTAVARTVLDSTRQRVMVVSTMTHLSTGSYSRPTWQIVADMDGVDTALARDFKNQNQTPLPMPVLELKGIRMIVTPDSVLAGLATVVTPEGSRRSKVEEYWGQFHELFPDAKGYIVFGGVGYNADGTEAIIDFGYHCGGLCGSGGIFKLRKTEGKWNVVQRMGGWRA